MAHDGPVTEPDSPQGVRPDVQPEDAPDVQPTGRPNARLRQTVGDMIRSLAVVLAVVFVIVLLAWRPEPEAVKVVDVAPVVALAAAGAEFPVAAPTGLGDGWRPTSARWEPTERSEGEPVLHVGYVTPGDEYAQVTQSTARSEPYFAEQADSGSPTGTQDIGGTVWQRWEGPDRNSLVLVEDPAVTIVSGTASWDELTELAASLEPVPDAG